MHPLRGLLAEVTKPAAHAEVLKCLQGSSPPAASLGGGCLRAERAAHRGGKAYHRGPIVGPFQRCHRACGAWHPHRISQHPAGACSGAHLPSVAAAAVGQAAPNCNSMQVPSAASSSTCVKPEHQIMKMSQQQKVSRSVSHLAWAGPAENELNALQCAAHLSAWHEQHLQFILKDGCW